jgi:hypothetical protein
MLKGAEPENGEGMWKASELAHEGGPCRDNLEEVTGPDSSWSAMSEAGSQGLTRSSPRDLAGY